MTRDPLQRVIEYLRQVPAGKALITAKEIKEHPQFRGRSKPLHEVVIEWATLHGFTVTTDRADAAAATTFYLRVKI